MKLLQAILQLSLLTSVLAYIDIENDESPAIDEKSRTISAINILLPISLCESCSKVQYEVRATSGCFQW